MTREQDVTENRMTARTFDRSRARGALPLAFFAVALLLPACQGDGHFSVLGYTTAPNYDCSIRTVYVPIFQNRTYYRGLEFDLTRAVIREIEQTTPFKVTSDRDAADTELCGTIINFQKNLLNRNQLNEVREAETILTVEVVWKNLKTGEILSQPRLRGDPPPPPLPSPGAVPAVAGALPPVGVSAPTAPLAPGAPGAPVPPIDESGLVPMPPPPLPKPVPIIIQSTATFIPEVGGSITTAQKSNVDRLAIQIIQMMEKPW